MEKYYWQYKFLNGTETIRFQMIEILSRLNFAGIVGKKEELITRILFYHCSDNGYSRCTGASRRFFSCNIQVSEINVAYCIIHVILHDDDTYELIHRILNPTKFTNDTFIIYKSKLIFDMLF